MWMPFVHNSTNYLIKIDEAGVKIFLTDLKCLWIAEIERKEFIERFKELNPLLEGSDDEIFQNAITVIKELQIQVNFTDEISENIDCECTLEINSKLEDLPVKLTLNNLKKAQSEVYFREVTLTLLNTVRYLELRHNKQEELLKKKDFEILAYNIEFGEVSSKRVITEKYVDDSGDLLDGLFLNIFTKSNGFNEVLVEKHGDISENFPELKIVNPKKKLTLPSKKRRYQRF